MWKSTVPFVLILAACTASEPMSGPSTPAEGLASGENPANSAAALTTQNPADEAALDVAYLGRWDAADGAALIVTDQPQGGMMLEFRDAKGDTEPTLPGSVTAEGLRFMRNGEAEAAIVERRGARSCLSISADELYCRTA